MDNKTLLRAEMDRQKVVDPSERAGIAAICMGESGFAMEPETGYAHTSNNRIRTIFGSRVSALSDAQLDALKADPKAFFNRVYGGDWGKRNLGNTEPDDGYNLRGRGPFQITGRYNYGHVGSDIGVDLIGNPDALLQPPIGCAASVAYMRWRYKGGGWEKMKAAVGYNIPDIEATKDAAYKQYLASGEFGPLSSMPDVGVPAGPSVPKPYVVRAKAIQGLLQPEYLGPIDGDLGKRSQQAFDLLAMMARKELGS